MKIRFSFGYKEDTRVRHAPFSMCVFLVLRSGTWFLFGYKQDGRACTLFYVFSPMAILVEFSFGYKQDGRVDTHPLLCVFYSFSHLGSPSNENRVLVRLQRRRSGRHAPSVCVFLVHPFGFAMEWDPGSCSVTNMTVGSARILFYVCLSRLAIRVHHRMRTGFSFGYKEDNRIRHTPSSMYFFCRSDIAVRHWMRIGFSFSYKQGSQVGTHPLLCVFFWR